MKKFLSFIIVMCLILSGVTPAFAEEVTPADVSNAKDVAAEKELVTEDTYEMDQVKVTNEDVVKSETKLDLWLSNRLEVLALKVLVSGTIYEMDQAEATNEDAVISEIKDIISKFNYCDVRIKITKVKYEEAVSGTKEAPEGTNGTYTFKVDLSKGLAKATTENLKMMINATKYVAPNKDQEAPEGLKGIAPTSAEKNDGKITGTTTAMEFKPVAAEDEEYKVCSAEETRGLAAGDYVVRFAAKEGFNAGETAQVIVPEYVAPNKDQEAPKGLKGVSPTSAEKNDGKITGTTTAMEFKLAADEKYEPCSAKATTGLEAGEYVVRFVAKKGFNAGETARVIVPKYVAPNKDQPAPEGLKGIAPTSAEKNDGKITGTTTAMEFKLAADEKYEPCSAKATTGLVAGEYVVRFAAKKGFNAGEIARVIVPEYVLDTDKEVSTIKETNVLLIGRYAFDLSKPETNNYNMNNFIVASKTAYENPKGTYHVYFRIGTKWFDIIADSKINNPIKVLNTINSNGKFNYMNMK